MLSKNQPQHLFALMVLLLLFLPAHIFAQKTKSPKKDHVITISTEFGNIFLILFDDTPKHKENFLKLTEEKFYDSTTFHRVMNRFMIQGGDPQSKPGGNASEIGRGGPGYTLEAEFVDQYKHDKGMLAAARQPDRINPDKRSSGCQFYIVQNPKGAHHLDGSYTIFGKVIKGIEIVDVIAKQPVNGTKPKENVYMFVSSEFLKKKKIKKLFGYTYEN